MALILGLATVHLAYAKDGDNSCKYINLKTLPITFSGSLPTVEASINGKPARMAIDSGAFGTILFRKTVEKLDLPLSHVSETAIGAGGESGAYNAWIKDMTIGPLESHKFKLGVIWNASDAMSEDGLVGADILFQRDIELFLAQPSIKFFHPVGCNDDSFLAYWGGDISETSMQDMSRSDLRKVVPVEINGHKIKALIDTGAGHSVLDLNAAAKMGITPQSPNVVKGNSGYGIGKNALETWVAPFDSFAIGDESIKNFKLEIADLWANARADMQNIRFSEWIRDQPEMILGIDFLRAHRLLFAASQSRLYFSYLGGNVFYTDHHKEDVAWYRKAAELGNADAQFNLGSMYETGEGVSKNLEEAAVWYRKAAEQGNANAQVNLGFIYETGYGVARDEVQAVSLYRKAAESGNVDGLVNLGLMYEHGKGVAKDEAQAVVLYRKAAELGYPKAQVFLGHMYEYGRGVPGNEMEAVSWYRKAADLEYAPAQRDLGRLYMIGRGVAKDEEKAISFYRKAADQGDVKALVVLGNAYRSGGNVPKDRAQAETLYRRASEKGFGPAYFALGQLLFFSGEFKESALALQQAVERMPEFPYPSLWLYLARSHIAANGFASKELSDRSAALKNEKWPSPVIDFYLGRLESSPLLKKAEDKDANIAKGQICEANFYVAENYLLQGKKIEAKAFLKKAERDCPKDFIEYAGATAELERFNSE